MELMYPIAIVACLICSIAIIFWNKTHKSKYSNGKKIANTQFIKETEYYKQKIRKYNLISNTIKIVCLYYVDIIYITIFCNMIALSNLVYSWDITTRNLN